MILIESNNNFVAKIFASLFEQRKLFVTLDQSSNHFFKLNLNIENNILKIVHAEKNFIFKLPITFDHIFADIYDYLSTLNIEFSSLKYNPIVQSIIFSKNKIYLGAIHNSIIKNLILNFDLGFDKVVLYKIIWPNDKNIQLNKLDTHMTNLKNKLKEINLNVQFVTSTGKVQLIIN